MQIKNKLSQVLKQGEPWTFNKLFENQYCYFTMFVGSSASELLSIVLLSHPLAVMGHWLACRLTLFCAGHSLTNGCDALFGKGEECWTGHPFVGVSVITAAPELAPSATRLDTEPPISKKKGDKFISLLHSSSSMFSLPIQVAQLRSSVLSVRCKILTWTWTVIFLLPVKYYILTWWWCHEETKTLS